MNKYTNLKSIISILVLAIICYSNLSLTTHTLKNNIVKPQEDKIYTKVDKMPEYKGGDKELTKFIINNITYPEGSKSKSIQGKVFISFIVNTDGTLSDYNVEKSVNKELDDEALRVIKLMPVWIAGNEKGKPVKVKMQLPIEFRLN
ncbi:MAG: hypothetical protein A2033_17910 [Bacteroidetes bacterium GWA2_31_9]|nr:MAG: hypothetical protein A2033_17910 [Bacteroidetes bacterium GWA2_31_9]